MKLCAICDNTNLTLRLCSKCREDNPGWSENPNWSNEVPIDGIEDLDCALSLADLQSPYENNAAQEGAIIALVSTGKVVPYRNGYRYKGKRYKVRPYKAAEIALELGFTLAYVSWVIRKHLNTL